MGTSQNVANVLHPQNSHLIPSVSLWVSLAQMALEAFEVEKIEQTPVDWMILICVLLKIQSLSIHQPVSQLARVATQLDPSPLCIGDHHHLSLSKTTLWAVAFWMHCFDLFREVWRFGCFEHFMRLAAVRRLCCVLPRFHGFTVTNNSNNSKQGLQQQH